MTRLIPGPCRGSIVIADLTTAELCQTYALSDEQVQAAVDAFLANPRTGRFMIADGYHLDLVAVVGRKKDVWCVATDCTAPADQRRIAMRMAILRARPAKA